LGEKIIRGAPGPTPKERIHHDAGSMLDKFRGKKKKKIFVDRG